MLRLFDYFRSSASYRVRIALNLKGVPFETVAVPLVEGAQRSPEHLARHPQGMVPALETEDGILTQSFAIIDWIERRYPEPRLIPDDPARRAHALAMAMAIACDIHPLNNLRVLKQLETRFGADQAARDGWYAHWVTLGFEALESMAGDGPYLGGDTPDIADIFLVPQMFNARRFSIDVAPYPRLVAADAAACALPAFADAHPQRFAPTG